MADVKVLLELVIVRPLTVTSASIASWAVGSVKPVPLPLISRPLVTVNAPARPVFLLVSTRWNSPGFDCTTEAVTGMFAVALI